MKLEGKSRGLAEQNLENCLRCGCARRPVPNLETSAVHVRKRTTLNYRLRFTYIGCVVFLSGELVFSTHRLVVTTSSAFHYVCNRIIIKNTECGVHQKQPS
jgi:hypothetical protein